MKNNTRIYNRWRGYTVADCDCVYCRHWRGSKRGCALESCCCAAERLEARLRERRAPSAVPGAAPMRRVSESCRV
jgi:hypothetical protein